MVPEVKGDWIEFYVCDECEYSYPCILTHISEAENPPDRCPWEGKAEWKKR